MLDWTVRLFLVYENTKDQSAESINQEISGTGISVSVEFEEIPDKIPTVIGI